MRVIELFAGAGGMALGFHRAGWETVALAEWDPHAQCVLKVRFPDVPLYGDVRELDGQQLVASHGPVDLVSGGAPCQDLSVAGKREGLQGDRSILFYDLIRIWEETGATYCLYENVLGALNSQKGADFAAVLSAFVGRAVAVPRDGWTGGGGVVAGPAGVAAWRVLDAQFFGVPQRRRRVFVLGTRAGGVDPAQVLLECDGVSWDSPPCGQAGEGAADDAQDGTGGGDWPARVASTLDCSYGSKFGLDNQHVNAGCPLFVVDKHSGQVEDGLVSPTIKTDLAHDMGPVVVVPSLPPTQAGTARTGNERTEAELVVVQEPLAINISNSEARLGSVVGAIDHRTRNASGSQMHGVLESIVVDKQSGHVRVGDTPTLKTDLAHDMGPVVLESVAFHPTQTPVSSAEVAPSMGATSGGMGVIQTIGWDEEMNAKSELMGSLKARKEGGGHEMGVLAFDTTQVTSPGNYSVPTAGAPCHPLSAGAHPPAIANVGRPRRLMPIECERLMGWEDGWADVPDPKGKPMADSHRYKMCGNGVVSHCAEWIARRLQDLDND